MGALLILQHLSTGLPPMTNDFAIIFINRHKKLTFFVGGSFDV